MAENTTLQPIARLSEVSGDIYETADYLNHKMDGETFVFVDIVHGPVLLAKWDADGPIEVVAGLDEVDGVPDYYGDTDQFSQSMGDGDYWVISTFNGSRSLAYCEEMPV